MRSPAGCILLNPYYFMGWAYHQKTVQRFGRARHQDEQLIQTVGNARKHILPGLIQGLYNSGSTTSIRNSKSVSLSVSTFLLSYLPVGQKRSRRQYSWICSGSRITKSRSFTNRAAAPLLTPSLHWVFQAADSQPVHYSIHSWFELDLQINLLRSKLSFI